MSCPVTLSTARSATSIEPVACKSGTSVDCLQELFLNIERITQDTMAHTELITSTAAQDFLQIGAKRFESLMEVHRRLLDTFERVQRDRLDRAKEETKLASQFATKVTSARSIPDIIAIYQQWVTKCEAIIAEDGRRFLDDSQKVANAALSLLSNGKERT
jgi:hypothetical protein